MNKPIRSEGREILEKQAKRNDQVGELTRAILKMEELIADRMKEQSTLLETSTAVVSSLDLQTDSRAGQSPVGCTHERYYRLG